MFNSNGIKVREGVERHHKHTNGGIIKICCKDVTSLKLLLLWTSVYMCVCVCVCVTNAHLS
jgi:hypothetical protein